MKKQAPFILEIPKPCNENWAEMTHMGLGRFCTHCQKTVTDISNMRDSQVVQLFQKSPDTHCIRAFASQLNRPINLPIQEPTHFYRIAVALGLTLVMAAGVDAHARPRPPLVEQNLLLNEGDTTMREIEISNLEIFGNVVDEKGKPISGAIVKVIVGGQMKNGNISEDDGSFSIKPIILNSNQELNVEVFSEEYKRLSFTLNIKKINSNSSIGIKCILGPNNSSFILLNDKSLSQEEYKLNEIIKIATIQGAFMQTTNKAKNQLQIRHNPTPIPFKIDTSDIPKYVVPKKNVEINKNKTYNEKDLKNFGL